MIDEQNLPGEHEEVFGLFPWYLNGTLAETERQKVDEHLRGCAACRDQLERERDIYRAMSSASSLEFLPASFSRLQARLDALAPEEASAPAPSAPQSASREGTHRRRAAMPWPRLAAASVAVLALGSLGLFAANRWLWIRALPSEYRTVTTTASRPPDEVVRAVFSPTITLVELQALLDEAQLRIISGPSEAGVYSLAATSNRPVTDSLSLLRRHASVRFAEGTRIEARDAGGSR